MMKKFALPAVVLGILVMIAVIAVPQAAWAQNIGQIPIIGQIVSASGNPIMSTDAIHAPPGSTHDNLEDYLDDAGLTGPQGAFDLELLTCSENAPSQPTGGQYMTETHTIMNQPQGWTLSSNAMACVDPDVVWAVQAFVDPGTGTAIHLNWSPPFQLGSLDLTAITSNISSLRTDLTAEAGTRAETDTAIQNQVTFQQTEIAGVATTTRDTTTRIDRLEDIQSSTVGTLDEYNSVATLQLNSARPLWLEATAAISGPRTLSTGRTVTITISQGDVVYFQPNSELYEPMFNISSMDVNLSAYRTAAN